MNQRLTMQSIFLSLLLMVTSIQSQLKVGGATCSLATPEIRPRKVLVVMIDDLGCDLLAEAVAAGRAPTLGNVIATGTYFSRYWSAPLCGPSRAKLLSGLDSHRPGNGLGRNVQWHEAYQGPSGVWLGEGLPGRRTWRGKWHISGGSNFPQLVLRGFDEFSGSLGNLNNQVDAQHVSTSYYSWWRSSTLAPLTHSSTFATNDTAASVTADVDSGAELIVAAFNAIHKPTLIPPPSDEPVGVTYYAGVPEHEQQLQYLQHLDFRLGEVIDRAIQADYVVMIVGDNGTSGAGKGTYSEDGVGAPLLVAGRGVRAGLVSDRLVQVTDIKSTVEVLRGAPWQGAVDSLPFHDAFMIGGQAVVAPRTHLTCDTFDDIGAPTLATWTRAARDARWKLVNVAGTEFFYDLLLDPDEAVDLLATGAALTPEQSAALAQLRAWLP